MTPAAAQPAAAPVALPVRTGRTRPGPATTQQTTLILPAIPESARAARAHARAVLTAWNLAHLTDLAVLFTSELVTNAIAASTRKAPPGKEGRPVIFSMDAQDKELITRVWDPDPILPPDDPAPADPYAEDGRGLLIITELSSQMGSHPGNGGKYVWAALPLPEPAALTRPAHAASRPPPAQEHPPWACTAMTPRRSRAPSAARPTGSQPTAGHPPAIR
jgi:hypothetical protein